MLVISITYVIKTINQKQDMGLFGSILIINTVIVIYTMSGFDIPIRKRL